MQGCHCDRREAGIQRGKSIGVLFGCFGRKIDGFPWFTWWLIHLPGPSISPKRTLMGKSSSDVGIVVGLGFLTPDGECLRVVDPGVDIKHVPQVPTGLPLIANLTQAPDSHQAGRSCHISHSGSKVAEYAFSSLWLVHQGVLSLP